MKFTLNLVKKDQKMSTCKWLDLETLGSRFIMSKNLPRHWTSLQERKRKVNVGQFNVDVSLLVLLCSRVPLVFGGVSCLPYSRWALICESLC